MEHVVWLTGMPRSGTNWLAQIFASSPQARLKLCPLFSYEFKNVLDENSSQQDWANFFPAVYATQSEYMDQDYLRRDGAVPSFSKHDNPPVLTIKSTRFHHLTESILQKCPHMHFVGIVRHPCAAIHSWLTNPLEFPKDAVPNDEWRSGLCRKTGVGEFWGFDDWKFVTSLFLHLEAIYPERFLLIRYEDLVADARGVMQAMFNQLEIDWSTQTDDFIKASQSRHSEHKRSVFKDPSVVSRWRGKLNEGIAETILAETRGTPLERFLDARDL